MWWKLFRFYPYVGDLIGLPTSDKHLNFRWDEPDCKVLFSACQQGNAASCHFASDKRGLRKLKQAINEFCDFAFWLFEWCEMIMAKIDKKSVERLVKRCGFEEMARNKDVSIWIKKRG